MSRDHYNTGPRYLSCSAIREGSWAGTEGMSGQHSRESITVCASQRNADGLSTAGECLASERKQGTARVEVVTGVTVPRPANSLWLSPHGLQYPARKPLSAFNNTWDTLSTERWGHTWHKLGIFFFFHSQPNADNLGPEYKILLLLRNIMTNEVA